MLKNRIDTNTLLDQKTHKERRWKSVSLSKGNHELELNELGLRRNIDGLIGVTLYNECGNAFSVSLASLAAGIEYLLTRSTQTQMEMTVCFFADGLSNLSASTAKVVQQLDLGFCPNKSIDDEMDIYQRNISIDELRSIAEQALKDDLDEHWGTVLNGVLGEQQRTKGSRIYQFEKQSLPTISVLFCIKKNNAGKLDSHWWMYRALGTYLNPKYCFQTDVGTAPDLRAIYNMWQQFENNDDVAGIASSIAPFAPISHKDLLKQWQYCNFSKTIFQDWPNEVAFGYLSVIPGQFSALKWQAIADEGYADSQVRPLDVYFKGLGELTPYETMLYLAEDRVLCSELATMPEQSWRLDFASKSAVVTDHCSTWSELYKQRKRWHAGYLACRVDFLSRIPDVILRESNTLKDKCQKSVAAIYHATQLLLDWFIPALLLTCYAEIAISSLASVNNMPALALGFQLLFFATFVAISIEVGFCLRGKLDEMAHRIFTISRSLQAIFLIVSVSWLAFTMPIIKELVLLFVLVLAVPLSAFLRTDKRVGEVLKHSILSAPFRLPIALSLWTYAICNTHDNSWGTKGLDKPSYQSCSNPKEDGLVVQRFLSFRRDIVATWIVSNLVFGIALTFGLDSSKISVTLCTLIVLTSIAVIPSLLLMVNKISRILKKYT